MVDPILPFQGWPPRQLGPCGGPVPTQRDVEEQWCERIDVAQSLEKLPPHLHMLADLISQGYSEREIAEYLDISWGRVRRWKQQLVDDFKRDWGLA